MASQSAPLQRGGMRWPYSAAACIVLWCIVVLPVSCGPSRAGGWSSYIATGPLLSWLRTGRGAFLSADTFMEGNFRLPWIGA
jgi:hypothetical protein